MRTLPRLQLAAVGLCRLWGADHVAAQAHVEVGIEAAIAAFIRAYENKRYDILLRFVPDAARRADASGPPLSVAQLQKAWEGEQKQEMDQLTQALRAALPTAKFELLGDRATMAYGSAGSVEFLRENGLWKIEDFR